MKFTKRQLLIVAGVLVLLLVIIILSFRQIPNQQPTVPVSLTPVPPNTTYDAGQKQVVQTAAPFITHEEAVTGLLPYVPYHGERCSFDYHIEEGSFILTLEKDTVETGREECTRWLQTHGVDDMSWIRNLKETIIPEL